jgi:hypothetical protein
MGESKFDDKEIEQERRKFTQRYKNRDEVAVQIGRDFLLAARTEEPEVFEARLRA